MGALNFRDIGGYPAGDGGRTRWGAVYRSDSPSFLTAGDLPAFDALGIKAIYDLRRSGEIATHPGPREYVHIELANRDPLEDGKSAGLVTRRDRPRSTRSGPLCSARAPECRAALTRRPEERHDQRAAPRT